MRGRLSSHGTDQHRCLQVRSDPSHDVRPSYYVGREGSFHWSRTRRPKRVFTIWPAVTANEFLRSERQVGQISPGLVSPFEQIEREVVVVPEIVSNALIVSSTPRYFEEIRRLVEQLDERPPMRSVR